MNLLRTDVFSDRAKIYNPHARPNHTHVLYHNYRYLKLRLELDVFINPVPVHIESRASDNAPLQGSSLDYIEFGSLEQLIQALDMKSLYKVCRKRHQNVETVRLGI